MISPYNGQFFSGNPYSTPITESPSHIEADAIEEESMIAKVGYIALSCFAIFSGLLLAAAPIAATVCIFLFCPLVLCGLFFVELIPIFFTIGCLGIKISIVGLDNLISAPKPEKLEAFKGFIVPFNHDPKCRVNIEEIGEQLKGWALYWNSYQLHYGDCLKGKKVFIMHHYNPDFPINNDFIIGVLSKYENNVKYFNLQVNNSSLTLSRIIYIFNNRLNIEKANSIIFSYDPEAPINRALTYCPEGQETEQNALLQVLATAYFMTCYEDENERPEGFQEAYKMDWDSVLTRPEFENPGINCKPAR